MNSKYKNHFLSATVKTPYLIFILILLPHDLAGTGDFPDPAIKTHPGPQPGIITFMTLRKWVGILGISLVPIVVLGSLILGHFGILTSVSAASIGPRPS